MDRNSLNQSAIPAENTVFFQKITYSCNESFRYRWTFICES